MLRSSKSNASFRSGTASGSTETNLHPNLGLHSAAASGNIGVVKFALDNGQPHNSILNGLFPLHAACSGGSEAAVRMLLAYGADVNVTRLRVNRGSGGGTGTEGSTPLHYAAANGHTTIVRILLENGARPTARDRDGTTPMSIAAAQGHSTCVALIRSWISAYGSNGLAGPQSSTVDQNNAKLQQPSPFSTMRTQRSFESLSSAAAGVKATLRNHKKQALAKVSSNPNLRSLASNSSPPSPPPPVPTASRTSSQNVPQSTPPQTLSSVPTSIARESKRRPSLPSILERAAQSSSAFRNALSTHSSQANQPDSIEELSPEEAGQKPPHSPIRTTHALASKRSLTGLLSKTSNNNSEDVTKPQSLNSSPLSLPRSSAARSRSGSVDVFAQSPVNHLARPDMSILQSSPTSSLDTVDNSTKQSSPASHAFRPRKSSNLSSTIHTLPLGEQSVVDYDAEHGRKRSQSATSLPKRSSPVPEREDSSKSLHSQRPSQRQQLDNHSDETKEFISTSSHSSLKERSSTPTRYRSSNRSPLVPSKMLSEESDLRNGGFLSTDPASPSLGFRQLHSQTSTSSLVSTSSSNNTNPRQPRMSSTSTTDTCGEEESKMYLEPRSMTRSNRSTSYSESTASKTSTTSARSFGAGLTAQEQAQAILRSADHNGPSSSSSSSSSYGVPAISLTQMLASYGEALAQERRGTSPQYQIPASLRTQAGLASSGSAGLGHQLRSVSENHLSPSSDSTSTNKVHPGSITPVSTPPDSPQTTRSRAESSATSFSRSPSSNRQKVTPKDLNKVTADIDSMSLFSNGPLLTTPPNSGCNGRNNVDPQWGQRNAESRQPKQELDRYNIDSQPPSLDTPIHRHSPSLPTDLSQFAGPLQSSDGIETTPRSKRRQNSHRPTTSDSHSSLDQLHVKRADSGESYSPTSKLNLSATPNLHKMSSVNNLASSQTSPSPFSSEQFLSPEKSSRNQQALPSSARWDEDNLRPSDQTGKRKGSVKAFLHGIKNNVVR